MGHHHRVGLFCCCCSPFPPIAAQEAGNETERKTTLNAPHSDDHVPASFVYITQSKLKLNQGTSTQAPSSEIFALEGSSLSLSLSRMNEQKVCKCTTQRTPRTKNEQRDTLVTIRCARSVGTNLSLVCLDQFTWFSTDHPSTVHTRSARFTFYRRQRKHASSKLAPMIINVQNH